MLSVLTVHLTLICNFFLILLRFAGLRVGLGFGSNNVRLCQLSQGLLTAPDWSFLPPGAAWHISWKMLGRVRCSRDWPMFPPGCFASHLQAEVTGNNCSDAGRYWQKATGKINETTRHWTLAAIFNNLQQHHLWARNDLFYLVLLSDEPSYELVGRRLREAAEGKRALKKSLPKNSGYTGTTEQDMKNSEQHEVHCCSRFVMSLVQAIGSWLQAVWVMLAPRTAKLSGGLADTAGRAFQNLKSSGLMHCLKSLKKC